MQPRSQLQTDRDKGKASTPCRTHKKAPSELGDCKPIRKKRNKVILSPISENRKRTKILVKKSRPIGIKTETTIVNKEKIASELNSQTINVDKDSRNMNVVASVSIGMVYFNEGNGLWWFLHVHALSIFGRCGRTMLGGSLFHESLDQCSSMIGSEGLLDDCWSLWGYKYCLFLVCWLWKVDLFIAVLVWTFVKSHININGCCIFVERGPSYSLWGTVMQCITCILSCKTLSYPVKFWKD